MYINWQQRELNLKVVYYGPALSGKTTNLEQIHRRVPEGQRSKLLSLKTSEDRTLFFDFMQLELGKIGGLTPKIQLYTVPGQSYYEASRRLVLRGTDGVVFVADSAPDRLPANIKAWKDMHRHLESFEPSLTGIPVIVQVNKQDLPNAISIDIIQQILRVNGYPVFPAAALSGQGVFESLKAVSKEVIFNVQRSLA